MSTPRFKNLVVAAWSVSACTPQQPSSAEQADGVSRSDPSSVVDVSRPVDETAAGTSANGPGGGEGNTVGAEPRPAAGQARPELQALVAHDAWRRLRHGWRALDDLTVDPSRMGPPPRPPEKLEGIAAEIDRALDELAESEAGRSVEPQLLSTLRSVVAARRSVLSGLGARLMVMHRLPTAGERAVARVGGALEQRIDALVELRSRGAMAGDEYRAALDAVLQRVLLLAVLHEARSGAMVDPLLDPVAKLDTFAELERSLAERRANATDAGADALDDVAEAIEQTRRLASQLAFLVEDLER